MGLIKNALNTAANAGKSLLGSAGGALLGGVTGAANQALFQEYFASGDMSGDILMKRAQRVHINGSKNDKSDANIISSGSVIDVQHNQCMIIVENGKVVEACMEPGQFTYNTDLAPSFFAGEGKFGERFVGVAKEMWNQARFGGQRHVTQRVYFINMGILDKSLNWGAGDIEFQHSEQIPGAAPLSIPITLKGHGTARLRIERPLDFYENYGAKFAGGDNTATVTMDSLDANFFTAAKNKVTESIVTSITELSNKKPLRVNQLLSAENMKEMRALINAQMDETDLARIGFDFYEFTVAGGFKMNDEDRQMIKELQMRATTASNINLANYDVQRTMAEGFKEAGKNGGVSGVMGMGMAMGGGIGQMGNMQQQPNPYMQQPVQQYPQQYPQQYQQPAPAVAAVAPAADSWQCSCGNTVVGNFCTNCGGKKPAPKPVDGWTCACGAVATGKFCPECGAQKPEEKPAVEGWTCSCGAVNQGKFCQNCGAKKPAEAPLYRCDKCGWQPEDPKNPPKFCPECGDRFDESDAQ